MTPRTTRRGFALIAVLWVLAVAAVIGARVESAARNGLGAARNRIALAQASWHAEGCIEALRARVADALATEGARAWNAIDSLAGATPRDGWCELSAVARGATLNVNVLSDAELERFLIAEGVPSTSADSLAGAIVDWRDGDDDPSPSGAERAWYVAHSAKPPRNGPFVDPRELELVRGFTMLADMHPEIRQALGTEDGPVLIDRLPSRALAALPGFTPEAVDRVAMDRATSETPFDLMRLIRELSQPAADSLAVHLAELQSMVATQPSTWVVTADATAGQPAVHAWVEATLAASRSRVALLRRRSWP